MMTVLTDWVIPFAYIIVGLLFARSRIRAWARRGELFNESINMDSFPDKAGLTVVAVGAGVFWPVILVATLAFRWLWLTANRDEERRKRLEADLEDWRRAARDAETKVKRQMASDIVETLEELLRDRGGVR
jgi:hypothetical protein